MKFLDDHGQPDPRIAYNRIAERNVDELIGLCKGILADGHIHQSEAEFLLRWLETNSNARSQWPANVIYPRLQEMLSDGKLDDAEQRELLQILMNMGARPKALDDAPSAASHLPVDDPAPQIQFEGSLFVCTGTFLSGTRAQVQSEIQLRGGKTGSAPTKNTHYLVIGEIGSRDWIHSTHGRKIEKAVELKASGCPILIVSEEHWIKYL